MGKRVVIGHSAAYVRKLLLQKPLEENGYEVAGATDKGAECVSLCRKYQPDLVILDIQFSDGTDYTELLPQIRKETPSAKVMMCSSMGQDAMKIEAFKNGAADYLVQPFKTETLLAKVRELTAEGGEKAIKAPCDRQGEIKTGKKVMIVHSEDKMKQMAETILPANGYELAAFTGKGKDCVKLYRKTKPDVVIIDGSFKDGTDFREILPALRSEDPAVKVVMCADIGLGALGDAMKKGIKDFLPWPCSDEQLLERVKVWCGK